MKALSRAVAAMASICKKGILEVVPQQPCTKSNSLGLGAWHSNKKAKCCGFVVEAATPLPLQLIFPVAPRLHKQCDKTSGLVVMAKIQEVKINCVY